MAFRWSNCAGLFIWFVEGKCFSCPDVQVKQDKSISENSCKTFPGTLHKAFTFSIISFCSVMFMACFSVSVAMNIYQETIDFHQLIKEISHTKL